MIKIKIKKWNCNISIGTNILEKFAANLKNKDSLFWVTDAEVYKIYQKKITKIFGENIQDKKITFASWRKNKKKFLS